MEVERRACRAAGNGFFASVYTVDFQSPLVNSDIICSASGFRSCSRKIRDVLVWCHHLRHQVTSLPSSWSWGCTVPMTTTEHFFQVFKASRREMAKKKFIQEQVCCDLRVPCKFPAHHRKIYVTPSYWRYTPPPSPLFPLLPLLKKTTTNRETKDLKSILEMFIKLRTRQSSDCAALLWVHQVNLTDQLTPKNCSQINGSHSLSVLQILEQFVFYCDVFGNTRENIEFQLWLDIVWYVKYWRFLIHSLESFGVGRFDMILNYMITYQASPIV